MITYEDILLMRKKTYQVKASMKKVKEDLINHRAYMRPKMWIGI